MWGIWNTVASYHLEYQIDHDTFRSTEENTALEACTAMSYLYGLLPVVLIDVVLPSRYGLYPFYKSSSPLACSRFHSSSYQLRVTEEENVRIEGLWLIFRGFRTKHSWLIHLSFFGTSAASIVVRGTLNPRFIAPSFVYVSPTHNREERDKQGGKSQMFHYAKR